jgi:hypothetical protein
VIQRALTDNGVELLTRISGLLLSAIAVQPEHGGVHSFLHCPANKRFDLRRAEGVPLKR